MKKSKKEQAIKTSHIDKSRRLLLLL